MPPTVNINPKTILAMSPPPPLTIPAASRPKAPQVNQPYIKTELDPRNESAYSIPPVIAIKLEPKKQYEEDNDDTAAAAAIKKRIAANLSGISAQPNAATIAADERALKQLGINIHPKRLGVEGTRPRHWEQRPGIRGMKTLPLDLKSCDYCYSRDWVIVIVEWDNENSQGTGGE